MYKRQALNDKDFLALVGLEVDTDSFLYGKKHEFNQTCHLCAILRNPAHAVPVYRAERYTAEAISAKIDEFHQNGYIVNYNHPTWSCEGADEFLHYGLFDGMEIFNYSAEVANNNGYSHGEYAPVSYTHLDVYKRQAQDCCSICHAQHSDDDGVNDAAQIGVARLFVDVARHKRRNE